MPQFQDASHSTLVAANSLTMLLVKGDTQANVVGSGRSDSRYFVLTFIILMFVSIFVVAKTDPGTLSG